LFLASLAIRSCFVDTLSGFKAPSVFLNNGSEQRCSASLDRVRLSGVPRRHQYYQSTKTSDTYHEAAYLFATPLQPPVSQFAPTQRRLPRRPGPVLSHGAIGYLTLVGIGSPRFLENPSHTSAPLSDPGRSHDPHPCGSWVSVPALTTTRAPALIISRLNHAASVSAAYASHSMSPHHVQGSLPAGG
jgi:hypothetical protein